MQPRIAFTLLTGNTVGRILMASPADRAQSATSFFWYASLAGTGCSREA
jgi:hypothetical protein